jgi:ribonuclease D
VTLAALTLVRPFINAFCFSINFDTERVDGKMHFPSLSLIGKYEAEGRILVIPLTGRGDINITLGSNPNTFIGALCW